MPFVFYIYVCQGDVNGCCAWFYEKIYYEFSPIEAKIKF